jgi:hypothetical protein
LAKRLQNDEYAAWWIEGPQSHSGRPRKHNSDEVDALLV